MRDDEYIEILVSGAEETGFTVDFLHSLTSGLSRQACLSVIGNASSMPAYMKSSDNPYVSRRAKAPSMDMRCSPVSQLDT